jgi:uncharacterized protein (DUF58 family)
MKVKKTFWVLMGLLLIVFLTGKQFNYQLINKVVYVFLVLILISGIWTRYSLNGLQFSRKARSLRKETGQVFEERFRLENKSPYIKSWVEIMDQSKLPGQNGSRVMAWVGRGELRNYSSYTLLTHRGKFLLSPTEIKSGDPFGLFEKIVTLESNQSLIVLPVQFKIHNFFLPPGYLPGGKSIRRRTAAITPHAAGIREYLPGDSMNRIHWKKTAQRGTLITKEFEEDPQSDIWIILDSHFLSHTKTILDIPVPKADRFWSIKEKTAYQLPMDSYEYAVSTVATIADYFIRIGQGVGFRDIGKNSLIIPPEKGYRQLEKIMESLAFIAADGEQTLETGVMSHMSQIFPGSLVIIIGTDKSTGLERSAESLKLRKIHPVFILMESGSFAGEKIIGASNAAILNQMGVVARTIHYKDSIPDLLEG